MFTKEKTPANVEDKFNGAYRHLLSSSLDSLADFLEERKGESYTNIPVGVGLLDIDLGDERFTLTFHYKNHEGGWETHTETDMYSNMRYHFQSFYNIMWNGFISDDFTDAKEHLPAFIETFKQLFDTENDYGVLPTGHWYFYYGSVLFKLSRKIKDHGAGRQRYIYTDSGIFIMNGKEHDGVYDYGYGGGGMRKHIFTDYGNEDKYSELALWQNRLDKFSDYL